MMRTQFTIVLAGLIGLLPLPACAQRPADALPPVPSVHGPLQILIRYPAAGSVISAGDSTFLFGTVGDGRASVLVNGQPALVEANGAWIAWIAIPPDSAFTLRIAARRGDDTLSAALPLVRAGWTRRRGAWLDGRSMLPTGSVWIPAGESLPVSVTASPGATVRLRRPGGFILTLSADSNAAPVASGLRAFDRDERNLVRRGLGDRYVGVLRDIPPEPSAPLLGTQSPPIGTRGWQVEVIVGDDTVRQAWPLAIRTTSAPIAVVLDDDRAKRGDTDRTTIGRTTPGGTYAWFFPAGTHAQADARIGNDVRLRLSRDAIAWVPIEEVHRRPASDDPRPARMGALTLTKDSEYTRLRIPLSHPVPLQVEQEFDRITVRLFGAFGDADWTRYDSGPDFVRLLSWRQSSSDQVELVAAFDRPLWGWRVRVDNSDLVLDFREPPVIDASNPLRGRNVVVDAGHPPLGACGPSGACESELNLLIAQQVDKRLRDAGARVTMTRADSSPVGLSRRVAIADSVGAEILVSIHNNALPDGVNPFTNSGSSTFFNHPNSIGLARAVQEQMVRNFGTRDLGVARGDLALVRPTWYPAILTEGLFMMIPRHEAALLSRAGQAKYADAVVDGIAEWLRGAQRSPSGGARQ